MGSNLKSTSSPTNVSIAAKLQVPIWFIGWLYTIGYVDLSFWRGVLALLLWPFYLGAGIHG